MKVLSIWCGYGKNHKYVCSNYVCENALEQYKELIKNNHPTWKKEFIFLENQEPFETWEENDKGNPCIILAYTKNGWDWNYKIK